HGRFFTTSDPNWWMRFLRWRRLDRDFIERGVLAFERDVLFRPQLGNHFQCFIGPRPALLDWDTTRLELFGKFAADSNSEVVAPTGRDIERRTHLGNDRCGIQRKQYYRAQQFDFFCCA